MPSPLDHTHVENFHFGRRRRGLPLPSTRIYGAPGSHGQAVTKRPPTSFKMVPGLGQPYCFNKYCRAASRNCSTIFSFMIHLVKTGAQRGTRTPTSLRTHAPEACASTNSAIWARWYAGLPGLVPRALCQASDEGFIPLLSPSAGGCVFSFRTACRALSCRLYGLPAGVRSATKTVIGGWVVATTSSDQPALVSSAAERPPLFSCVSNSRLDPELTLRAALPFPYSFAAAQGDYGQSFLLVLAGQAGFEPATSRLTAERSTN